MDGIIGQDRALDALRTALRSNRLHHALIFHGPVGVGKMTTARAVARVLLCHERPEGEARWCGTCPSCLLFERGEDAAHPDLHVVTKELARYSDDRRIRERKLMTIPVDVLRRALLEPVYRAAQLRHNKVFLVDEAEMLAAEGQNRMLKTLEEPPDNTYVILVTSNEDRLLITVRSRCQRIAFVPLADEAVSRWMDAQTSDLSTDDRQWLVPFAAGSLGQALLVLEYGLVAWSRDVLPHVDAMRDNRCDPELGARMASLIETFAKQWVDRHDNASKEAANRRAAQLLWSMIGRHARGRLAETARQCTGEPVSDEPRLEPWLAVIDALQETERDLAAHVNISLVCDHLVSRMSRSLAQR